MNTRKNNIHQTNYTAKLMKRMKVTRKNITNSKYYKRCLKTAKNVKHGKLGCYYRTLSKLKKQK